MKAVLAIDTERYLPMVELCGALAFEGLEAHLVHVVEPVLPGGSTLDLNPSHPIHQVHKQREAEGREHLGIAERALGAPSTELKILHGAKTRSLMDYANGIGASLIGAGSGQKGTWSSLFYGSTTRELSSNASQSLLVGKSRIGAGQKIRAIWCTDHSQYNYRCLDEFLAMKPKGLEHVTVLTASQMDESVTGHLISDLPEAYELVMQSVTEDLQRRNEALCKKFIDAGFESSSLFLREHPTLAIDSAIRTTDSNLLILGAQGHNFWDRVRLGSVSHHALVATPHNALIVRGEK